MTQVPLVCASISARKSTKDAEFAEVAGNGVDGRRIFTSLRRGLGVNAYREAGNALNMDPRS